MKIVSLLPSATEILCALGLENQIVGITHECDFPLSIKTKPHLTASRISHETMTSAEIDHAVRSQLDGHGSIYDLNTDLLARINPDLIFTQELCDVCAVNYEIVQKAAKIYTANSKVISLEPNTVEDIFENIKTVGDFFNVSDRADELIANLKNRLEKLKTKTGIISEKPKVFMLEWLEPPFAPGHWIPEQVEAAGGICLLGEPGKPSVTTAYEEIAKAAPDIIVMIPCGYYTEHILRQLSETVFPEILKTVPAVRNGELWALDATSYFSRPGPRVIDGAEILSKIIHPKFFGVPDKDEAVKIPIENLRFTKTTSAK